MRMNQSKSPYISLGVIGAAHGVRGDLKVKSFIENPKDLAHYAPLYLNEGKTEVRINAIRSIQGDKMVVHLEGVDDRNQAELLKGLPLMITRDQLPEIEDDETFYHTDLIGLQAISEAAEPLGSVIAVQDYGAGDILEIQSPTGIMLVAFTKAYVPEISLEKGTLTVLDAAWTSAEDLQ